MDVQFRTRQHKVCTDLADFRAVKEHLYMSFFSMLPTLSETVHCEFKTHFMALDAVPNALLNSFIASST